MSTRVDTERTEMAAESKVTRAKKRIAECMDVNRLTYEGLSVTLIGQRLGFSRDKVRAIQHWLGWRTSNMKWALGSAWCAKYPESESEAA